jgi:hypothetical protein
MHPHNAAIRTARTAVATAAIMLLIGTAGGSDMPVTGDAPARAATSGGKENVGGMARFAGKWVFMDADPGDTAGANTMDLRFTGAMLVGQAGGKDKDTIAFNQFDGHRIKGTLMESDGSQTPVHATLSTDGSQLILEVRPPASEIYTVVAVRDKGDAGGQSANQPGPSGGTDGLDAAQAELDAASAAYRGMVERGETAGIEEARTRYKTALENVKQLKAGTHRPTETPSVAATPTVASTGAKTEDDAIEAVAKQAEVAAWIKAVRTANRTDPGRTTAFRATDNGKAWEVQAFENVRNADGGHTATFGWYSVDKQTGRVSKIRMDAP